MIHHDQGIFSPTRATIQLVTAHYVVAPFLAIHNRLQVIGRQKVPKSGPLVVVANHISPLDPPLLVVALNRPVAFMAKKELFANPVLARLLKLYCAFPVNRSHPEPATFKTVEDVFRQGWALGMFPEGTRSRTPGRLGKPHAGPAFFAKVNKVSILPVGIVGTHSSWGKAIARVGNLIEPSDDVEKTTWDIMEALSSLTGFEMPERQLTVFVPQAMKDSPGTTEN